MNPFKQRKERLITLKNMQKPPRKTDPAAQANTPTLFAKCPECAAAHPKSELAKSYYVCPACGYHHKISAYYRLSLLLDGGSFAELDHALVGCDPLNFAGYGDKAQKLRQTTGLNEAVVTATGRIEGRKTAIAVLDSRFLMGSMGTAVGEKLTRLIEHATKNKLPLIIFSASGGARMQEGIYSLMQMAKTSAAIEQHNRMGLLYVSVCTNPTTGGVTASFASLGDVILAEPGALIGFAGPRVIEETIRQALPEGFQSAEYLLQHGFVDSIVPRHALRATLSQLLMLHSKGE